MLQWAQPAVPWLGLVVATIGAVVAGLGVYEFRKACTTVDPRTPEKSAALVVTGVYRLSRNPMYAGFLLVLIAWAVHLANLAACIFPVLFMTYMNHYQIGPEEKYMRKKFGDDFDRYAKRVRRWI